MRIAVFSCAKYSDAWHPFFVLFRKFWPDCPYPVHFVIDSTYHTPPGTKDMMVAAMDHVDLFPYDWNGIVARFAERYPDEPIMMFLEDYFLTSTPHQELIDIALEEYERLNAACVRLYPCPGAGADYGHPLIAGIPYGAAYRVSTQVAIWNPATLATIARSTDSPQGFELDGTRMSGGIGPFLGWKRDAMPWPIEYICTGIVRGVWQRDALAWCEKNGIRVDTSRRPTQPPPIVV